MSFAAFKRNKPLTFLLSVMHIYCWRRRLVEVRVGGVEPWTVGSSARRDVDVVKWWASVCA